MTELLMGVPYAEVIGDPIGHSKSPAIHEFWLRKLGLDYDFRATRVAAGQLPAFLAARRNDPDWCGCSITLPHKIIVAEQLDDLSGIARFVGAVNCITRQGRVPILVGHNTDVAGFLAPLLPWLGKEHEMRLAHVVGTGGAAAAASAALHREGFTILSIGRDRRKALELRQRLQLFDDHLALDLAPYAHRGETYWGDRVDVLDLIVNATPLGMTGYPPLPFELDSLPESAIVYDLVYDPLETPLLKAARERALVTIDGLGMLIAQAAEAFEMFFAEPAPRAHDDELRELLTR
jgi:shikimate dehydrogenase